MMNRRTFAVGLGTLAGGSAAAVGTGAFSAITASRNFDVTVSGDATAYLGLQPHPGPNGAYAEITTDDTLAIDFTSNNSNIGSDIAGGDGVNANGVSLFLNVFRATNQGTQDITVDVQPLIFLETDGNFPPNSLLAVLLVPALSPTPLSPGDSQEFYMIAFSFEADGQPDVGVS
jgi:hypothetical protein